MGIDGTALEKTAAAVSDVWVRHIVLENLPDR
jgi:hypothetical protein